MQRALEEKLLGRKIRDISLDGVQSMIKGRTVLVSGGGGSIGSELCRQIAICRPALLIVVELYENNAYMLQQELIRRYKDLNFIILIGSVRDSRRLYDIFMKYRPDIVIHAAAHKHVPLMEVSPAEAVKNNVIGTYKIAYVSMLCGVDRFILISTDKAARPVNIMGASKRLCEMIIQSFDYAEKNDMREILPVISGHSDGADLPDAEVMPERRTKFCAVRFGNVLGSNGSVVPLFLAQIEAGGPVTVTHPDIARYFISVSEAVSLILKAGIGCEDSEVFELDMGDVINIYDLAVLMIRYFGYEPDKDIPIEFIGLRPGEKLKEDLLDEGGGYAVSQEGNIRIGHPLDFDRMEFLSKLQPLLECAFDDGDAVRRMLFEIVPEYGKQSGGGDA